MSTAVAETTTKLPADPMVSVRDVARMFNVTTETVYDWIRRGDVPQPVRIGKTIRWPRAVIARLLEQGGSS